MLAKPTENVLPIEATSRGPGIAAGRHIGAILMDDGKLTVTDAEQVLKRQRELRKAEKAAAKREKRAMREGVPEDQSVATNEDLAGYGFPVDAEPDRDQDR